MTPTKQIFEEQGYAIARGLIPQSEIDTIAEDMNWLAEKQLSYLGIAASKEAHPIKRFSRNLIALHKADPVLQSCLYNEVKRRPWMFRLAADERIMNAIRPLLSDRIAIHPQVNMVMSMPGEEWHLAVWHQDVVYVPDMGVIMAIPLQPTNAENGGLSIAPGAHKKGALPHARRTDWRIDSKFITIAREEVESFPETLQLEMNAGDALMMHRCMPHNAGINRSEDVRFSITLRYADLTEEFFANRAWRWEDLVPEGLRAIRSKKELDGA